VNAGGLAQGSGTLVLTQPVTNAGTIESLGRSTVTLGPSASVSNRNLVHANGGTVNIQGAIVAGAGETGDFRATGSDLNITGTIQNGVRNTFTAYAGGTITLPGSPTTGNLYQADACVPWGRDQARQWPDAHECRR